jgi:hypothetical protein
MPGASIPRPQPPNERGRQLRRPYLCCRLRTRTGHPQHRANAHAELSGDPPETCPLGAGCDDRRDFVGVGILEPPAAKLGTFDLPAAVLSFYTSTSSGITQTPPPY